MGIETRKDKFWLSDGSYSLLDIQDYFEHIIKKYETLTNNSQIRKNINRIGKRITFEIKSGYYLEFLTPEITLKYKKQDKNDDNVSHLEITEVIIFHCDFVSNSCKQNSSVSRIDLFQINHLFG